MVRKILKKLMKKEQEVPQSEVDHAEVVIGSKTQVPQEAKVQLVSFEQLILEQLQILNQQIAELLKEE